MSTIIPWFWNSFFASLKVDSNLDVHEIEEEEEEEEMR